MIHAVIMAGGGGTRFWPRSRKKTPKQFLKLTGERTLLQQAYDRIEGLVDAESSWVITSAAYREQVQEQIPSLPKNNAIGEPMGRDTAPCIGLGAALIAKTDPEGVMFVTPADHVIEPIPEFQRAVRVGLQMAEENPEASVTFGITPTYPSTGYGYVHRADEKTTRQGVRVFNTVNTLEHKAFKEKPPKELAEEYIATGEYFWNSGLFIWKVKTILEALKENQPTIYEAVTTIADAWGTPDQEEIFREEYSNLSKISIDFAVMENAKLVMVVEAPFQWEDVGSWQALERMNPQDVDGNTVQANHVSLDTKNCIVVGDSDRLITTIGVDHLLIVQDGDAILVADKREEGAVKQLVNLLKEKGLEKYL
ncbi:MAG: mannose-1-phosphate guanylyltransferase [Gemmataceae bacterium]